MNNHLILHFEKAGMQTLVVDEGRNGFQAYGVPKGGFLDRKAAMIANWLVGNDSQSALLEIALMGPKIRVEGEGLVAFTGADLSVCINGKSVERYKSIQVKDNDVISYGKAQKGCRSYLAISGSIQVKSWLSSKCAIIPNVKKFTPESLLSKGDKLLIRSTHQAEIRKLSENDYPEIRANAIIRVIKGPEFNEFAKEDIEIFKNTIFRVSPESNRMGYRLESGIKLITKQKVDLISSGIVPGTIQITNLGKPIILLADAQTSGGYPRIANVVRTDLDLIAQLKPGDSIQFSFVSVTKAQELWKESHIFLEQLTL